MSQDKNFGHLGTDFQQSLIKAIVEDRKYGIEILDFLESKYFDNNSFKFIVENIRELYKKYGVIPDYETLKQKINAETNNPENSKIHLDTLDGIIHKENFTPYVQETALNFCKQQNLKKDLKKIDAIINSNDFESYDKIIPILEKSVNIGVPIELGETVFDNMEEALSESTREAIPTGISGLDNELSGGLGKKELGVILAPTGIGKTTILTKIANTAFNHNKNVLQIFFEDNKEEIKKKHYTIWTGIPPRQQPPMKNEIIKLVEQQHKKSSGKLFPLKLRQDETTVDRIKAILNKYRSEGIIIDVLIIDYVDCIVSNDGKFAEEWKSDGQIMRQLESMTDEFNIALWTATQGNRESLAVDVVKGHQMGGSFKKAQIAHILITIARSEEQKENKMANIYIQKNRIGRDGVLFNDCKFDNEYLEISTDQQTTFLGMERNKEEERKEKLTQAYLRVQKLKGETGII